MLQITILQHQRKLFFTVAYCHPATTVKIYSSSFTVITVFTVYNECFVVF